MPLAVDDEFITEDAVFQSANTGACVTAGFILHSQVFQAALQDHKSSESAAQLTPTAPLERKIEYLRYMLDDIPDILQPWLTPESELHPDVAGLQSQFASLRANLHVTHLWLQSILLDQLEVLHGSNRTMQKHAWNHREELSRQLLQILHSISLADIEPNGLHLAYKVRDVAVGLFACPFKPEEPASQRAAIYVRRFTDMLSRLDASETVNTANLQSWVDTDRIKGPVTPGRGAAARDRSMAWP